MTSPYLCPICDHMIDTPMHELGCRWPDRAAREVDITPPVEVGRSGYTEVKRRGYYGPGGYYPPQWRWLR